MNLPRINAMFIVSHDEAIPPIRLRFVEIDGTPYFLAQDVATYLDIKADQDGDCRSTLVALNVPFVDSVVYDRGKVFGPVTLVTDAAKQQFETSAATSQKAGD